MINLIRTAMALPGVERRAAELRCAPPNWQARQDTAIREIVAYAANRTRFYQRLWREAGCDPRTIRGATDLGALPVVVQTAWRGAMSDDILARDLRGPLFWNDSGGTTGAARRVPVTLRDDAAVTAGMLAVWRLNGVPWIELLRPSPPLPPASAKFRRVGRLLYLVGSAAPSDVQAVLETGRFPIARCLPGLVWRAVVPKLRRREPLPPLRLLVCGAEVLTGAVRRTLARALSARIVNHYGTSEAGHLAYECASGRLHVFWHTVYLEILGENGPAAPGELGEVVVTSFVSHGRPVIRLRTGDMAAWGSEACPCGNPAPHLAVVAGRDIDRILTPSARAITWPDIEMALEPLGDNLLGFQVESAARGRVLLRLSLLTPPDTLEHIRARMLETLGGVACDIELTDDFKVEASNKTRPVLGWAG